MTALHLAWLGCGLMGTPMARRLLAAGWPITVWNRTQHKTAPLQALGAQVADSPYSCVAQADVIFTMLEDGPAVDNVLFAPHDSMQPAAVHNIKPGALVIDMSSILPKQAQTHAARLQALAINHIDAPVSGGTLGAEAGTLAIMAGGQTEQIARARPLLEHLGKVTQVGSHGAGQWAKLANQMIVGISIGAIAEALIFARSGQAEPAQVRNALRGGFAESRILEVHGQRMVTGDFSKRGSLAIQLKDLRNALTTAQDIGLQLPITQLLEQLYTQAFEHGLGELDQSGLFCELEQLIHQPAQATHDTHAT